MSQCPVSTCASGLLLHSRRCVSRNVHWQTGQDRQSKEASGQTRRRAQLSRNGGSDKVESATEAGLYRGIPVLLPGLAAMVPRSFKTFLLVLVLALFLLSLWLSKKARFVLPESVSVSVSTLVPVPVSVPVPVPVSLEQMLAATL